MALSLVLSYKGGMKPKFTDEQIEKFESSKKSLPDILTRLPKSQWPETHDYESARVTEVWVSKKFQVSVFRHNDGADRLNINRMEIDPVTKTWKDGITWDELQDVKRQCGRGNKLAIEIFPKDEDFMSTGNFRHLWIIDADLPFSWAKNGKFVNILTDRLWN